MSNRPTGFPLGKPIRIAEKHSGPSVYDTPFDSVAEACATIAEGVRGLGLTVKVLIAGKVVEYWWESGTTNAHLVQKATSTGGGTGGSTIQTIEVNELSDIDNLNLSENLYIIKGGVKGQLIVVDDEAIVYTAELSGFICEKAVEQFSGELGGFACVKSLPLNLITVSFETHAVTVHSSYPVASDVTVGVQLNDTPSMFYITIPSGSSSNVLDPEITVTSAEIFSVTPEFDSEYDYYFATLE